MPPIGVLFVVRVPLGAMRFLRVLSGKPDASQHIDSLANNLQMARIYTRWSSAEMVEHLAIWNLTYRNLISDPMSDI
jgi:hypothetical protein